jgi:iron(III) transport system permease protein
VTLPLTTPGYVAGALLVFIWTFSDFATPLVLGVQDLLAPQAYLNIVQFVDRRIFRMGIVISTLMVLLAVLFLLAARHYVAIKDYSSLSYSRVARRRLAGGPQILAIAFLSLLLLLSFIPYIGLALASVGKGWALTPLPVAYTLQYYERVIVETPKYILNSFLYSGLAVVICVLVGVPIAWLLARSSVPGRGALDAVNTLILAVPGTAIGIAYIRAFHFDLPGFDRGLTSFWIVMPLVLAVRRLPYTVRGSFASLLLVHHSLEEAAGGAVPGPRRVGVDHQRHLRLLHRGQRQRGGRPRGDPHRGRGHQRGGHQPHGGHPHGRRLRLVRGQVLHSDISAKTSVRRESREMSECKT